MLFQTTVVVLLLISQSQSVPYGKICHPLVPELRCNPNSGLACAQQSDGKHICLCAFGNILNKDGLSCSLTYDANCFNPEACNGDRGLYCATGIAPPIGWCRCSEGSQVLWDWERETCVGRSQAECDPATQDEEFGKGCVPYATCDAERSVCSCDSGHEENAARRCVKSGGLVGDSCERNEDCDFSNFRLECGESTGRCECARSQGYHAQRNGTCARDYGERCSSVDPCDTERFQRCSSFSAQTGTCVCKDVEQEYNHLTLACAALVGDVCGDDDQYNPGIGCIVNAECTGTGTGFKKSCHCLPGFIPSIDNRECVLRPTFLG